MLDFSAMLAIADMLPVMIAYRRPRRCVYRFVNKPLAEWLGRPREEMLGRARARDARRGRRSREREPMIEAALAGERQFFASEFDHPTRGPRRGADRLCAVGRRATARCAGIIIVVTGRHRAARRRAGAARERGAVPADRQFGAGDDVGDPARPRARLRQRRLCRVRLRAGLRPRGGADARLAHADPSRRRRPDRRREHRRRSVAAARSRSRGATGATTANIAGCAACRSRASGRTASWSGSSASAATSPSPRRPSSSFAAQVEERTARAGRVAKRSSARCSRRRSR